MRKTFLFLVLSLIVFGASAQFGLQVSAIAPAGNYGRVFKPSAGVELAYDFSDQDEQLKFYATIGFYSLKTHLDTFPIFAIENGSTLIPGRETYDRYVVFPMGVSTYYKFIDRDLSPALGLDFYIYFMSVDRYYEIDGLISSSESGGKGAGTVLPKVGLTYNFDFFTFSAWLGKSYGLEEDYTYQTYWKPSVSAIWYY